MGSSRTPTPAELARFAAGLSQDEAALRIGVTKPYLSRMEKQGSFNYPLAQRFARVYGCPIDVFIYRYKTISKEGAKGAYRNNSRTVTKRRTGKGEAGHLPESPRLGGNR